MSLFLGVLFLSGKKRNLNSYYRCSFLLFQLILYSIIMPTLYERTERTFRNSRSYNCLSRTIVVFPLVFRLNIFTLFFLFPTVHFLSSSLWARKKRKIKSSNKFYPNCMYVLEFNQTGRRERKRKRTIQVCTLTRLPTTLDTQMLMDH